MPLSKVRKELNVLDDMIKSILTLRMSIIPLVAKIKKDNNLELFQPGREKQIYENIEKFCSEKGLSSSLVKDIYQRIIEEALSIEHNVDKIDFKVDMTEDAKKEIDSKFERLNTIFELEIPQLLSEIEAIGESSGVNLSFLATDYYRRKNNI